MRQVHFMKRAMVAGLMMISIKGLAKGESEEMAFVRQEMKPVTMQLQQTLDQ